MSVYETAADLLELGRAERVVPLDGSLRLADGHNAPVALVQTPSGVWVVAAEHDHRPEARAAHDNPSLRYEIRLLGDRVHVDGHVFGVPLRRGAEVKLALAVGRLLAQARTAAPLLPGAGSLIDEGTPLWSAWLASALEPDEVVLAWLETSEFRPISSDVLDEEAAPVRWFLSDRRHMLIACNDVGDTKHLPLSELALRVDEGPGRVRVTCGSAGWTSTRRNGERYRLAAGAPDTTGVGRLLEIARAERPDSPRRALRLLFQLEDRADDATRIARALLRHELDGVPLDDLGLDDALDAATADLADTLAPWDLSVDARIALVARGVDRAPDRADRLLPLHRAAHAQRGDRSQADATRVDIVLAEHLLLSGESAEATTLLEARLASLPDEQLSDLLPPPDADLTAGEAGQAHRIRVLELLAISRGDDAPDVQAITQLAQLQPLVASRIERLLETATETLADRAAAVAALHGTLAPSSGDGARVDHPLPLGDEDLTLLQHPAARDEGVVGWMQGWLAHQQVPDQDTLKRYCERLSPRRHEAPVHALTSAAMALGTAGLEAYVSHGVLGHGLRAFEDEPSYVLIGGQHLYEDSPEHLTAPELRFAVAAEVAHLRFQHNRVTASEVWDGAMDKMKRALDLAATALSFGAPIGKVLDSKTTYTILSSAFSAATLSRIYTLEKTGQAISTVGAPVTTVMAQGADAVGSAQSVQGGMTTAVDKMREYTGAQARQRSLAVEPGQLVLAHRVMQLTADRAGLLLSGDVGAAVRAIFITSPDALAELPIAEQHGLERALSRRGPDGEMLHQDLAIRVGALLGFYLSEDYSSLRSSMSSSSAAALASRTDVET
ncbi:MAG: hypothetical protein GY913_00180 [Proteobacteria bacterium]|nr:hypothetical protein [Pseudomonadota bacterium]MCP4915314.1 hypothetical protein [Pseudomonadota bacterium]